MTARIAPALLALLALGTLLPSGGAAQERPSEADLFGAPAEPPASPTPAPAVEPAVSGRDEAILGGKPAGPPAGVMTAAQENPLAIGGLVYLRASTTWSRGSAPADWPLGAPNLADLYVDSRPNDRVRAYALVRTLWSPLTPPSLLPELAATARADPYAVLDQLWIKLDLHRRLFVTAGRQHVKWGVGRFWNPTDYLHPVRRDPLATFDDRTGATMVKLHVPWEARGWNFYGFALLDDPAGKRDDANAIGKVAGAARAEVVIGAAELGADAVVRSGQRPRFGADFSAGIWDLDVHGEVALRTSSDVQLWKEVDPAAPVLSRFGKATLDRPTAQAVIGVSYAFNYSDEDAVRFAAEYFYNGLGYDDAHIYPWLMVDTSWGSALGIPVPGKSFDFVPFYVGRHYAGVNVLLAAPGSWNDHTFSLSGIVNASDGSAIVRLDHAVVVNTYLTVESYLAGSVGTEGGEFRFSLDIPSYGIRTQPPVLTGGVALRAKL